MRKFTPGTVRRSVGRSSGARAADIVPLDTYYRLFMHNPEAMILTSPDGGIVDANDAACLLLARSRQELRQLGRARVVDMSDPRVAAALELRAATGSGQGEMRVFRGDGSVFEAEVASNLFVDRDKRTLTSMVIRDISARQALRIEKAAAEESLRETNRRLNEILASIAEAFYAVDDQWRITYVNRRTEDWWRLSRAELAGKVLWELFPYKETDKGCQELCRAMRERVAVDFENYSEALDVWIEASAFPTSEGGLSVYFRDITGRKRAEAELRYSEERFQTIFNHSPDLMAIISVSDNKLVEVNEALLTAAGYTLDDLMGCTPQELGLWAEHHELTEGYEAADAEKGAFRNVGFDLRTKSGQMLSVLASIANISLNGELCRIIVMKDVTGERQMENDMTRIDRLGLVGEMAASIGHEIRNPLTTVLGYLQLFRKRAVFSGQAEQLDLMVDELYRANSIITEYLSLAINKAVDMNLGSLSDCLKALFPLLQADALRRNQNVELVMSDTPDIVFDEKELRQLLLNLVRNAFEAMKPGDTVKLTSFVDADAVVLTVQDTGPGIPQEVLTRIGTPFVTTKEQRTGLGLAVCYRIVHRHQAKIDFRTSAAGTTVSVRLPRPYRE